MLSIVFCLSVLVVKVFIVYIAVTGFISLAGNKENKNETAIVLRKKDSLAERDAQLKKYGISRM